MRDGTRTRARELGRRLTRGPVPELATVLATLQLVRPEAVPLLWAAGLGAIIVLLLLHRRQSAQREEALMSQASSALDPDPGRVADRAGFGQELTLLREAAGLTVRDVAAQTTLPVSTVGGYFSGTSLPGPHLQSEFEKILRVCGVSGDASIEQWQLALRRARRRARARSEPTPAAYPPASVDPPAGSGHPAAARVSIRPPTERLDREPRVQGRAELLGQLTGSLNQPHSGSPGPRVHVLHGLGGCGKSTIALALARRAEDIGALVWWVSAVDPDVFLSSLQAVAISLGATPDQLAIGSLPDQVWRQLSALREPWLLVIDNADDPNATLALPDAAPADGNGWLRPLRGPFGAVIVTSRDGGAGRWPAMTSSWLAQHPVPALSPDDGALVLRELTGDVSGSTEAARSLSVRLGGLPLALRIAGHYLRETLQMPAALVDHAGPGIYTYDQYRAALDAGDHKRLLDPGPTDALPQREALDRTWDLSFELLDARGASEARTLIWLLSWLRAAPVPVSLLNPLILAQFRPLTSLSPRRLWYVVSSLVDLGLLSRSQDDDPELVLHPVVRDMARSRREPDHDPDGLLAVLAALLNQRIAELDPKVPGSWQTWSAVAQHCTAPIDLIREYHLEAPAQAAPIFEPALRAVRYLRAAGRFHAVDDAARPAIEAGTAILGRGHPTVLALRHELSRAYYDAGAYRRAKRGFHQILADRRQELGADHPDTLTTAHYLARVLRDHGQLDEAERRFRAVLEARRRVLGERHPDTLTTMNNLGDLLRLRGQLDLAQALLETVLAERNRLVGPEHPATLVSRYNLALLTRDRGDLAVALDLCRDLERTSIRVLGPDHPRTLNARQALACVHHALGDLRAAAATIDSVMNARVRTLGAGHPATLESRYWKALILRDAGDRGRARELLAAVLAARNEVLGADHPQTRRTVKTLDALIQNP